MQNDVVFMLISRKFLEQELVRSNDILIVSGLK